MHICGITRSYVGRDASHMSSIMNESCNKCECDQNDHLSDPYRDPEIPAEILLSLIPQRRSYHLYDRNMAGIA
jgi:hypothetical protein